MKRWEGCLLAVLAVICMLWMFPEHTPAAENQVVVSVEKGTLGQGFLIEPTFVILQPGDTAKTVTERLLNANGRKFTTTQDSTKGYYLSGIEDPSRGEITIPEFVQTLITEKNLTVTQETTPDYLSEFDYTKQSGWMYSVDGVFPEISAEGTSLKGGETIRWQFTLAGLGEDLKYVDSTVPASERLNDSKRKSIYKTLAYVRQNPEIRTTEEVQSAYTECVRLVGNLTTRFSDIKTVLGTLNIAANKGIVSDVTFCDGNTSTTVKYGTASTEIVFPTELQAQENTKDDGATTVKLLNVTWKDNGTYDAQKPGRYKFYPEISLNTAQQVWKNNIQLPAYQVTVLKENGEEPDPEPTPGEIVTPPVTPSKPTVPVTVAPTQVPVQETPSVQLSVSRKTITAAYAKKSFSLGIKAEKGASVSVKSANSKIIAIDKNKKAVIKNTGKTVIKVTASLKGKKTAEVSIPVSISPVKMTAPVLKSAKSKQLTVSWKKDSRSSGYQIMYSTDKKFKKNCRTADIKKYKVTRTTLKKLSGNKKYYVKIRSYKKTSDGYAYGAWSTVRNIKVKK